MEHEYSVSELDSLEAELASGSLSSLNVDDELAALEQEFAAMEQEFATSETEDHSGIQLKAKMLAKELVFTLERASQLVSDLKRFTDGGNQGATSISRKAAKRCQGVADELSQLSSVMTDIAAQLQRHVDEV